MSGAPQSSKQPAYAEKIKGKTGLQRIINAFGYSMDGFKAAMTEQGFRQLVYLNSVLLVLCFLFPFSPVTRMILVSASFLCIIVELFNTGVEAAVDHTSVEKHELAKRAKDVCSAAQFVVLTLLAVLWMMALWREFAAGLFS